MKIFFTFLVTFLIAFATSALYEFDFFTKNWVRFGLVVLLIVFEFAVCLVCVKSFILSMMKTGTNG